MKFRAHAFVDGAYLRRLADDAGCPWPNPWVLATRVVAHKFVQRWGAGAAENMGVYLVRTIFYDAQPEEYSSTEIHIRRYWESIELLPNTEVGFGTLREGTGKKLGRQKGVDTLLAVDMLVGAFTQLYDVGILISGDSDFVPVVNEVRRRGPLVFVAAAENSVSSDLRRACDNFIKITPSPNSSSSTTVPFGPMIVDSHEWPPREGKG